MGGQLYVWTYPFHMKAMYKCKTESKIKNKIAQLVQAHLRKRRASWFERINRRRKPAVFNVCDYMLVSRKRFKQFELPEVFVVRQPPKIRDYVLHHSSFTPPSSGHKPYFVFHNKSSCHVPRNLISLGSFRGLGAFFWFVASIDRE